MNDDYLHYMLLTSLKIEININFLCFCVAKCHLHQYFNFIVIITFNFFKKFSQLLSLLKVYEYGWDVDLVT